MLLFFFSWGLGGGGWIRFRVSARAFYGLGAGEGGGGGDYEHFDRLLVEGFGGAVFVDFGVHGLTAYVGLAMAFPGSSGAVCFLWFGAAGFRAFGS